MGPARPCKRHHGRRRPRRSPPSRRAPAATVRHLLTTCPPCVSHPHHRQWTLSHILNTHHHWDHTGANLELKERHGATIIGPKADAERIPGIDQQVGDGDDVALGSLHIKVFDTPGHTKGHISMYVPGAVHGLAGTTGALFCGDTLFAMGCGRLFEGTPAQMWTSLQKLAALPATTAVFCAHEYTQSNARFALHVDGGNAALRVRAAAVDAARSQVMLAYCCMRCCVSSLYHASTEPSHRAVHAERGAGHQPLSAPLQPRHPGPLWCVVWYTVSGLS